MPTSFHRLPTLSSLCAVLAPAFLLAACGGGGSSDGAPSANVSSSTSRYINLAGTGTGYTKTVATPADTSSATTPAAASLAWGTFERPFAATSLWNGRPVGAVLGTATIPASSYAPAVSTGPFSSAAFKATATDGPVTIVGPNGGSVWEPDGEVYRASITLPHWPAGVVPASGADGHAEIVDTVSGRVHSFWQLRQVDGVWQATQYAWTPLAGRGMGDAAHYFQGARAAGVSTLGGLIRKHEINDGDSVYRHALAVSLTFNGLAAKPAYRFPATSADWDAATTNTGSIPMGSRLMLPADFDAQALATPELRKVAETLKAYGAYVVDRNYGTPFYIYVENGADFNVHRNGWNDAAATDLDKLRKALRPLESAASWLDGNNQAFDPNAPTNLLSMRGYWWKTQGPQAGVFDTWLQAVAFPATSTLIEQVNAGGRAYSGVTWAQPTLGATYRLTAFATGGAKFRMTLKNQVTGSLVYDSGELADGQTVEFAWPAQSFVITTTARSGTGGVASTVRAELVAKAAGYAT
jgi:hypothetical protein